MNEVNGMPNFGSKNAVSSKLIDLESAFKARFGSKNAAVNSESIDLESAQGVPSSTTCA